MLCLPKVASTWKWNQAYEEQVIRMWELGKWYVTSFCFNEYSNFWYNLLVTDLDNDSVLATAAGLLTAELSPNSRTVS